MFSREPEASACAGALPCGSRLNKKSLLTSPS